jgi:hypothetical protein
VRGERLRRYNLMSILPGYLTFMVCAIILIVLVSWLGIPARASRLTSQESKESQPAQQTSSGQNPAVPQETQATKPCPTTSDSSSAKPANCKPAPTKRKKHQHAQPTQSSETGPSKTVVRNGSTPEPSIAISPDVSDQETLRRLNNADRLLASADANLKQIAGRQLTTSQEDTVKQIRVYMDQARTAEKNGEVQRAYVLANKANLLAADLAAPPQ